MTSTLWPRHPVSDYPGAIDLVRATPDVAQELRDLAGCLEQDTRHDLPPWRGCSGVPLHLHARYHRAELMALFREHRKGKLLASQSGVLYHEASNSDLLFVTLEKTETNFSPTTRYNDYAISEDRFHWESQNTAHPESRTGRRYVGGTSTVLLFVREKKHDPWGGTAPFTFLGPATLESHEGERPMQIVWRLEHSMPGWLHAATQLAS